MSEKRAIMWRVLNVMLLCAPAGVARGEGEPVCGLTCYDPRGLCIEPCPMRPGVCTHDSQCCSGQFCRPGGGGSSSCGCVPDQSNPYWGCSDDDTGVCLDIPEPTGPRGYTIHGLGTFGGPTSSAYGINARSQIVGWADTPESVPRAALWQVDQISDPGIGDWQQPLGINNSGQILIWPNKFWDNGVVTPLLLPQTNINVDCVALNDLGHVVGRDYRPLYPEQESGFLWVDFQAINLNELTGEAIYPADINNADQIVGTYRTPNGGRAFCLQHGLLMDLPTLDGFLNSARSINDLGQIAGYVFVPQPPGAGDYKPVIWMDGQIQDVDAFYSLITINNCGEVLTALSLFHPIFGAKDIEVLFPAEDLWSNLLVEDLNDYGEIVGSGQTREAGYEIRGFFMRQTPGDFNPDGNIDLKDVTLFVHHWENKLCLRTDVNRDGVSDLRDFARFQIVFGTTTLLPKTKNH